LGQRNLPVFTNGKAVVDVGVLTAAEKSQILYNHINFGGQTQSWKKTVKPHLDAVAKVDDFLPGIAERLGEPAFTKSLGTSEKELIRFMEEPREHLIDTINALEPPHRVSGLLRNRARLRERMLGCADPNRGHQLALSPDQLHGLRGRHILKLVRQEFDHFDLQWGFEPTGHGVIPQER
jgi:hypothetical protein